MFDRGIDEEIMELFGRELQGKLNDALLLILLTDKYESFKSGQITSKDEFTTRVIAVDMDLPQSTVATVVSRLLKKGYVNHKKGQPVEITAAGRAVGNEMLRHHRMIEIALCEELGLSHDDSHDESIKLMLMVSCKVIQAIDKKYNLPKTCPAGEPIPSSPLCIR